MGNVKEFRCEMQILINQVSQMALQTDIKSESTASIPLSKAAAFQSVFDQQAGIKTNGRHPDVFGTETLTLPDPENEGIVLSDDPAHPEANVDQDVDESTLENPNVRETRLLDQSETQPGTRTLIGHEKAAENFVASVRDNVPQQENMPDKQGENSNNPEVPIDSASGPAIMFSMIARTTGEMRTHTMQRIAEPSDVLDVRAHTEEQGASNQPDPRSRPSLNATPNTENDSPPSAVQVEAETVRSGKMNPQDPVGNLAGAMTENRDSDLSIDHQNADFIGASNPEIMQRTVGSEVRTAPQMLGTTATLRAEGGQVSLGDPDLGRRAVFALADEVHPAAKNWAAAGQADVDRLDISQSTVTGQFHVDRSAVGHLELGRSINGLGAIVGQLDSGRSGTGQSAGLSQDDIGRPADAPSPVFGQVDASRRISGQSMVPAATPPEQNHTAEMQAEVRLPEPNNSNIAELEAKNWGDSGRFASTLLAPQLANASSSNRQTAGREWAVQPTEIAATRSHFGLEAESTSATIVKEVLVDVPEFAERGSRSDVQFPIDVKNVSPLASRAEVYRSVVTQMQDAMARSGTRPVEIALNPEELGNVRIALTLSDATIGVSIVAERSETLELLRRNVDQLLSDFKDMGYDDINLDFSGSGQKPEHSPEAETREDNVGEAMGDTGEHVQGSSKGQSAVVTNGLDIRI